ncbi:Uncharacterized protein GBIM_01253 [Gryllus bimaculatus]|nr:Uncharacterized protein GBIM_01253 [Gryllus bimaculatus]
MSVATYDPRPLKIEQAQLAGTFSTTNNGAEAAGLSFCRLIWNHQLFYTVTELASTVLVVQLADKRNPVTLRKAIGIAGIGMMHVIGSSWDNFVSNVIHGKGYTHQVARDLGLMIPDLLHVVLPLLLLRGRFRKIDAELQKEFLGVILLISSGLMVCNYL